VVGVVEEEEPLQLGLSRRPVEPPKRGRLLGAQELHRHAGEPRSQVGVGHLAEDPVPLHLRPLHALCQQLTETGTRYPDTNLTISYSVKGQPDTP